MYGIFKKSVQFLLLSISLIAQTNYSFSSLSQVHEHAQSITEYPEIDNDNWLNPIFATYHKSLVPNFFSRTLINMGLVTALWTPYDLQNLLNTVTKERELNGNQGRFVQILEPQEGDKFFIWGDLHGAFHSLVRALVYLETQGVIDSNFKILNSKNYFVFNGNVINQSAYSCETLTLILNLMAANPQQVLYLRGSHEDRQLWHDLGLGLELQARASFMNSERPPLNTELTKFFNTLPLALYLKGADAQDKVSFVRISPSNRQNNEIDEKKFGWYLENTPKEKPDVYLSAEPKKSKNSLFMNAIIRNEDRTKSFTQTSGLVQHDSEEEAASWSVLSSPTGTYRRMFDFFYDAYVVLTVAKTIPDWTIALHNQDVRENLGFQLSKTYKLASGEVVKESSKQPIAGSNQSQQTINKLESDLAAMQKQLNQMKEKDSAAPNTQAPIGQQSSSTTNQKPEANSTEVKVDAVPAASTAAPAAAPQPATAAAETRKTPVTQKILTFGSTLDLSKGERFAGRQLQASMKALLKHAKEDGGGVDGIVPQVQFSDDEYTPAKARENVERFIAQGIDKIIISVGSPTLANYLDLIKEKKIAAFFPTSGAPMFRKPDLTNLIHFRKSYFDEGKLAVSYALDRHRAKKIAIVYQNDAFGIGALEGAMLLAKERNIDYQKEWTLIPYERADLNLSAQAAKLKEVNPDAIIFFAVVSTVKELINVLGVPFLDQKKLISLSNMSEKDFADYAKEKGLQFITMNVVPNPVTSDLEIAKEFRELAAKENIGLDSYAFEGYIAGSLLLDALKKIPGDITSASLLKQLESIKDTNFKGLELNFDPETRELSKYLWINEGDPSWKQYLVAKAVAPAAPAPAAPAPIQSSAPIAASAPATPAQITPAPATPAPGPSSPTPAATPASIPAIAPQVPAAQPAVSQPAAVTSAAVPAPSPASIPAAPSAQSASTHVPASPSVPQPAAAPIQATPASAAPAPVAQGVNAPNQAVEQKNVAQAVASKVDAVPAAPAPVAPQAVTTPAQPGKTPVTQKALTFGSTLDLSKGERFAGRQLQASMKALLKKTQEEGGGIDGIVPQVQFSDDEYTPAKARENVERFIAQGIDKIIISVGSPTLANYLDLVKEKKIAAFFPTSGAPMFRKPDLTNMIHFRKSYFDEGKLAVSYALDRHKAKKIAIVYQNDAFGIGALEGAMLLAKERNIDYQKEWTLIPYERADLNLSAQTAKLKEANPDAIIFFAVVSTVKELIKVLGVPFLDQKKLISLSNMSEKDFADYAKEKGLQFITMNVVPNPVTSEIEIAKEFRELAAKENIGLDSYAFEGYIAGSLLLDALKKITGDINSASILKQLESIKDTNFKGLELNFDPETRELSKYLWINEGDPFWKQYLVVQPKATAAPALAAPPAAQAVPVAPSAPQGVSAPLPASPMPAASALPATNTATPPAAQAAPVAVPASAPAPVPTPTPAVAASSPTPAPSPAPAVSVAAPAASIPTQGSSTAAPAKDAKPEIKPEQIKKEDEKKTVAQADVPVTEKMLTFGSTLDLTKGERFAGTQLKAGMTLYLKKMRDDGESVHGIIPKILFLDDEYTTAKARDNAERFIKEGIDKTIGSMGTPTLEGYLDLVKDNKIGVFFPATGAKIFRDPELKNVVNLRASYVQETKVLVEHALDVIKANKLLFFIQNDAYGKGAFEGAKQVANKRNIAYDKDWKVVFYERAEINLTKQAGIIKETNPDTIIFLSTPTPTKELIQLLEPSYLAEKKLLGTSDFGEAVFKKFIQEKGLRVTIINVMPNPMSSSIPIVNEFREYASNNNVQIDPNSLEGYLCVAVLVDVMKKIKGEISIQSLVAQLEQIKEYNFKGLLLNFSKETRELLNYLWLDTGEPDWKQLTINQ